MNNADTARLPGQAVDLFAGPGGWSVACQRVGVQDLGVELEVDACSTRYRAGHRTARHDVKHLDPILRPNGGLIGSPPCQAFSTAGKGAGRRALETVLAELDEVAYGATPRYDQYPDARTGLVLEPMRWVVDALHSGAPYGWVALEQVPSVLPVWQEMARYLRAWGYSATSGILRAEQYGVPQTRSRAFLVARLEEYGRVRLPAPTHSRFYSLEPHRVDPDLPRWVSMAEALGLAPGALVGFPRRADGRGSVATVDGVDYRGRDLRPGEHPAQTVTEKVRSWSVFAGAGTSSTMLDPRPLSFPAHTITGAGSAEWGVRRERASGPRDRDPQARRVTVEEAGVLQTFPADYPWAGSSTKQYQQVGNAVPPLLAEAVLRAVLS